MRRIIKIAAAGALALWGFAAVAAQADAYEYCQQEWDRQHGVPHQVCSPVYNEYYSRCQTARPSALNGSSECSD